jgi:hypothetical protein
MLTGHKLATYVKPILSGICNKLHIPKFEELYNPSEPNHPFYGYYNKDFSKERYRYSTLPIHIGNFKIDIPDKSKITNVLRVPIKTSDSRTIVLPSELDFLKDFILHCCIYETSFNDKFEDMFAHLTVDFKEISENDTQRTPGWHVDGFQGNKFPIKHQIEHSYLWTSCIGTEFCPQPYFIDHIDDSKYMIFDELSKQAKECNVFQCMDQNIYIFDPYMVHRSPVIPKKTNRLLIRMTFETIKLLDPNDTVNPQLIFDVPYKYDIRNRLGTYEENLNMRHYGFIAK